MSILHPTTYQRLTSVAYETVVRDFSVIFSELPVYVLGGSNISVVPVRVPECVLPTQTPGGRQASLPPARQDQKQVGCLL